MAPSPASSAEGTKPPKAKRVRLSCSCDRCRQKKIKCDDVQPSCGPCVAAGAACITTKAGGTAPAVRRKTGLGKLDQTAPTQSAPAMSFGAGSSHSSVSPSSSNLAQILHHPPPDSNLVAPYPPTRPPLVARASTTATVPQQLDDVEPLPRPGESEHQRINDAGSHHVVDHRSKFVGASSSQALLRWLDAESNSAGVSEHLSHGMASTEEFVFPGLDDPECHLPDMATLNSILDTWFTRIAPLWPFLEEAELRSMVSQPREDIDPVNRTLLYALSAYVSDMEGVTCSSTPLGNHYLQLAWKSLPSVLARPFRPSIQALLMICLNLQNRAKDGATWTLVAMAIRNAYSYGMHLRSTGPHAAVDARIWFAAYCLDKINSFEAGRPSAIDGRATAVSIAAIGSSATFSLPSLSRPIDAFTVYASLCQQIDAISQALFVRGVGVLSVEEALRRIGERDAALLAWAESVPAELRPSDSPPHSTELLPYVTRLHFLYHHAMIILHRLSLFDHQKLVQPNLDKPSLAPYAVRLSSSPNVCITSARVTLGALELISRHYPNDRSWTLHCVFTAIIVLSIHTWQNADTWQARADLSLLEMASEFSAELFGRAAFPAGFTAVFPKLVEKTRAKVERRGAPSRPATRSGSPVTLHMHDLAQLPLPAPLADNPLPHDQQYAFDQSFGGDLMPQGDNDFASLWPYLLGTGGLPIEDGLESQFTSGFLNGQATDFQGFV